MRARWVNIVFMVTSSFALSGCWDSTEIDRLAIATTTGVDVGDAGSATTKGSVQIAVPSELGTTQGGAPSESTGSTQSFVVLHGVGKDPIALIEQARKKVPRKLIMSHRSVIIVGEQYAKQGVAPLLDEVVRNPQSRLRTTFVVAFHDTAEDVLSLPYPLERLPSQAVEGFAKQISGEQFTAKEFIERLLSRSDPYSVGIEATNIGGPIKKTTFLVRHVAIFQKDKLVGWLRSGDEVNGFLWLRGTMEPKLLDISIPGYTGTVGVDVLKPRTIAKAKIIRGQPQIFVKVQMHNDIVSNGTTLNLQDPRNIHLVESAIRNQVTATTTHTLHLLQEKYDSDPVGFAEMIYRQSPKTWAQIEPNWREELRRLPVHVDVQVHVPRTGLSTESLVQQERESSHD